MLTRTATRRSAAVLMVALVAMLLVATGGSARAAQARTSVGTGQVTGTPHHGRQAFSVAPATNDQSPLHLDLASTPPLDVHPHAMSMGPTASASDDSHVATPAITTQGRAPPAR